MGSVDQPRRDRKNNRKEYQGNQNAIVTPHSHPAHHMYHSKSMHHAMMASSSSGATSASTPSTTGFYAVPVMMPGGCAEYTAPMTTYSTDPYLRSHPGVNHRPMPMPMHPQAYPQFIAPAYPMPNGSNAFEASHYKMPPIYNYSGIPHNGAPHPMMHPMGHTIAGASTRATPHAHHHSHHPSHQSQNASGPLTANHSNHHHHPNNNNHHHSQPSQHLEMSASPNQMLTNNIDSPTNNNSSPTLNHNVPQVAAPTMTPTYHPIAYPPGPHTQPAFIQTTYLPAQLAPSAYAQPNVAASAHSTSHPSAHPPMIYFQVQMPAPFYPQPPMAQSSQPPQPPPIPSLHHHHHPAYPIPAHLVPTQSPMMTATTSVHMNSNNQSLATPPPSPQQPVSDEYPSVVSATYDPDSDGQAMSSSPDQSEHVPDSHRMNGYQSYEEHTQQQQTYNFLNAEEDVEPTESANRDSNDQSITVELNQTSESQANADNEDHEDDHLAHIAAPTAEFKESTPLYETSELAQQAKKKDIAALQSLSLSDVNSNPQNTNDNTFQSTDDYEEGYTTESIVLMNSPSTSISNVQVEQTPTKESFEPTESIESDELIELNPRIESTKLTEQNKTETIQVESVEAKPQENKEASPTTRWADLFKSKNNASSVFTSKTTPTVAMHLPVSSDSGDSLNSSAQYTQNGPTDHQTHPQLKHKKRSSGGTSSSSSNSSIVNTNWPVDSNIQVISADQDPVARKLARKLKDYRCKHSLPFLAPRGFSNHGNFCYINATLQALLCCPPFYNFMRELGESSFLHRNQTCTPILDSFARLFANFQPNEVMIKRSRTTGSISFEDLPRIEPLEPKCIYKVLGQINNECLKGKQEDAEEFLSSLLNGMNEEIERVFALESNESKNKKVGNATGQVLTNGNTSNLHKESESDANESQLWKEIGSRHKVVVRNAKMVNTPITEIFGGLLHAVRTAGKDERHMAQPFFTLQLDIQSEKVRSVEDALRQMTKSQPIQDYTCPKTNKHIDANYQSILEQLPPILILHVKLFSYDKNGGMKKLMKKLDFPMDLEMPRECLLQDRNRIAKSYKLLSVVYHEGTEAHKGHFLTDLYHIGAGLWLRCDDSVVSQVSVSELLHPNAPKTPYLLFYRRYDTLRSNPNRN